MSHENVEIVKRGFEHYIETGETPWELFDEDVEIYDHDTPGTGFVYAVPQGPHLYQPDDWADRAKAATAAVFHPTADRAETIDSLKQALRERGESGPLLDAPEDVVRPFAGLGLGYLLVDSLYEAMDHERLLDAAGFWADVTAAVEAAGRGDEGFREHLKAAAACPNVFCKLSGMVTEADWRNWKADDLKPYVQAALDLFGPDRCMFGSDWPVCELAATYERLT